MSDLGCQSTYRCFQWHSSGCKLCGGAYKEPLEVSVTHLSPSTLLGYPNIKRSDNKHEKWTFLKGRIYEYCVAEDNWWIGGFFWYFWTTHLPAHLEMFLKWESFLSRSDNMYTTVCDKTGEGDSREARLTLPPCFQIHSPIKRQGGNLKNRKGRNQDSTPKVI